MRHNFKKIEPKWQKRWDEAGIFKAVDNDERPKFYGLVEFPYPSGSGMHVGHIKAYSSLEVISRKRRMEGYNVLFPIGFDAFGLPTENYAIKTGVHPRKITDDNIERFSDQLKKVGFSYDWTRVVDTTDEDYYKWTQWIFLKMFEKGLVFKDTALVNYCPSCKVVLSNEDSQGGKCDICHSDIIQKSKSVWFLRITEYADKLLEGLETVDYLPNIKQQQVNWIGKSQGAFVDFSIEGQTDGFQIYTTRPDTLFGVTFMVIAPEHPMIDKYGSEIKNMDQIRAYRENCAKKTEFERTQLTKDKTGVEINGLMAVHPLSGKEIPIYIADYVMMSYGTGAIMAVPAHDQRDYEFARKFGIPILPVIEGGDTKKEPYTGEGRMINSDFLNGLTNKKESISRMVKELERLGAGKAGVQYKMKDWAFNRQRYWGEPIPIVHCPDCGVVPMPYEELPLRLPEVENFEPGLNGQSPLARIDTFVNCKCPRCKGPARRETDTMPQWAGSSWYFLRYADPRNKTAFADPQKLKYWLPVDWYNGGMEHVTRHMIYSRFWHHFLYDMGLVNTPEPYKKRTAQGLILGPDGEKMSKSKGNVVDPLDVVDEYGADVLRTYILFMGDYSAATPWNDSSVKGCKRFLERVAGLLDVASKRGVTKELESSFHKTIRKVSSDIEEMKFNTAIAALMGLLNEIGKVGSLTEDELVIFVKLLCPIAPHLCEEIWESLGKKGFLSMESWPKFDEEKTIDATVEVGVQVNGRLRSAVWIPADCKKEEAVSAAAADVKVAPLLEGKSIIKEIYVPNKIVNLVVK